MSSNNIKIYHFSDIEKDYITYRSLKYISNGNDIIEKRINHFISLPLGMKFCLTEEIVYLIKSIDLLYERLKPVENSIAYESFSTASIEGAISTIAETMKLVNGSEPKDKSEQMIKNNITAIKYLHSRSFNFSEKDLLVLWNIVTSNVLDNENLKGTKYRNEDVKVGDYTPPSYNRLEDYMEEFFYFCNAQDFILSPYIKSAIIQFLFVWIHPFCDGNGRTARLLSTQYLIKNGYIKYKNISISSLILETRNSYYKALKNSENAYNDITYFIEYYLRTISNTMINAMDNFYQSLNSRQVKAVNLIKQGTDLNINKYCKKFSVSEDIAQTELLQLATLKIIQLKNDGFFTYKFPELKE